jgi:hypothetical protein
MQGCGAVGICVHGRDWVVAYSSPAAMLPWCPLLHVPSRKQPHPLHVACPKTLICHADLAMLLQASASSRAPALSRWLQRARPAPAGWRTASSCCCVCCR